MIRRKSLLVWGGMLLGGVGFAHAATERWTPFGPDVSTVRTLAFSPSGALYAGTTENGTFRSADRGARWTALGGGEQVSSILELAIDPEDPRRIYAVTFAGLFRSRNGGGTWEAAGTTAPLDAFSVAIAPSGPDRVYALNSAAVEVSRDRGTTWQRIEIPMAREAGVLRVDPRDPDVLYAGISYDGGFFKSTDAGLTWQAGVAKGGGPTPFQVISLALDPRNPDVQYIGTRGDGVWKSTDAGATWEPVLPIAGLIDAVTALAVDPVQTSRVYAGTGRYREGASPTGEVWRSEDSGATWSRVFATNTPVFALATDPARPGTVYAGLERKGVVKSEDRGATWQSARQGLRGYTVHDVEADPHEPGELWIAAPEGSRFFEGIGGNYYYPGLYHTTDGGRRWLTSDRGIASPAFPVRIVHDPVRPERLWTLDGTNVFRSVDGGATWQDVSLPFLLLYFRGTELVIDPSNPDRMYFAGSMREGSIDFPYPVAAVLRSLDGGETWEALRGGFGLLDTRMHGLAVHPNRPATVYAGGSSGFFRSRNGGDRWFELGTGLPCYVFGPIVVDPFAGNILYAVTCDGNPVYKSTDFGATWRPTSLAVRTFTTLDLVADPHRPGTLYAAGHEGVFVTENRGATWKPLNTGLPPGDWVLSLEADPHVPGRLYAGLRRGGLYVLDRSRR